MVGGGAQIFPEDQAQGGLTESRPVMGEYGEIIWRVGARLAPSDVSVRAWMARMNVCPEQWEGECLSLPYIKDLISNASSGDNSVNSSIGPSWIPTSIGGQAIARGNDVRVAQCEEDNPVFHWFKIGDFVFQLQSYQSPNLCLDNNDQGYVSSSLRVRTCNNGYSPQQSLLLDAYDWPLSASEQAAPFSFESLLQWSSSVPLSLNASLKTDGAKGLSVGGANYRVVNSVPSRMPIAGPESRVVLDVYIPGQQPNPYWLGAVQAYASCPSAQMHNAYIGQVELTGRPTGDGPRALFPSRTVGVPIRPWVRVGTRALPSGFQVSAETEHSGHGPNSC